MDVIALVGPSGTGKSHRALVVAHEHNADAIIDDGLLIKDGKIVAGYSAKREASKVMAVRRAIFLLPGHAEDVRAAIAEVQPHRILILGTSENMVHKIATTLQLPVIREIVRIEDIATKEEMEKAYHCRIKEGKHIIPVPTIELKPHFSGYLIDPLESFFKKSRAKRRRLGEKSIVRPIFSYYGKLVIDDAALTSIIKHVIFEKEKAVKLLHAKVRHVKEREEERGIEVSVEVSVRYGSRIMDTMRELQAKIKDAIEKMTGMLVRMVHITVKTMTVEPELSSVTA